MDYHILHFIQDILRQICGVYLVLLLANPPVSENSPLIKSCKVMLSHYIMYLLVDLVMYRIVVNIRKI